MIGEQQRTKKLFRDQTVETLHDCHICFFLYSNLEAMKIIQAFSWQ